MFEEIRLYAEDYIHSLTDSLVQFIEEYIQFNPISFY